MLKARGRGALAASPPLREAFVVDIKKGRTDHRPQTVDVLVAGGIREEAREKAATLVTRLRAVSRREPGRDHALEMVFYRSPTPAQPTRISRRWRARPWPASVMDPEVLWRAYEPLRTDKVRGAGGETFDRRRGLPGPLPPTQEASSSLRGPGWRPVRPWLAQQENTGRTFTAEQRQWLEAMRDHIVANMQVEMDDFEYTPFSQRGGAPRAHEVFGEELGTILDELNEVLAA